METEVELQSAVSEAKTVERVGILGGSFNPPHVAHLLIAEQVRSQLGLEKVYFMPNYLPPHVDEKPTLDPALRLNMLQLAISSNPYFEVETIELERKEKSYTVDTMKRLKKRYPHREYYFIIGGDMVEYLPKWKSIEEVLQLVKFVAVERPSYGKQSPYPVLWVDVPLMELSSSEIRKKVLYHQSIRYLVPENVERFIVEKELYQS